MMVKELHHEIVPVGSGGRRGSAGRAVIAAGAGRVDFGTPHGLTDAEGVTLLGTRVLPLLRATLPN